MKLLKDTKHIIGDLPDLIRRSVFTSMGLLALLLSQIILHVIALSMHFDFTKYLRWQLVLLVTLTILFMISMLVREYYKKRGDAIMNKLDLILEALKK